MDYLQFRQMCDQVILERIDFKDLKLNEHGKALFLAELLKELTGLCVINRNAAIQVQREIRAASDILNLGIADLAQISIPIPALMKAEIMNHVLQQNKSMDLLRFESGIAVMVQTAIRFDAHMIHDFVLQHFKEISQLEGINLMQHCYWLTYRLS